MWVFGYGSLTWRADFPYESKLNGYIKGFVRRFYQHSVDHRGTPENPGRVVTLLPGEADDKVWGVAYQIPNDQEEQVMAHLDYREKDGYRKETVMFYPFPSDRDPFELTLYIGTETNKWYAGPADIPSIAAQILRSHGPSGANTEYLYNLAETMREIAPDHCDDHLFTLEEAVINLEKKSKAEQKPSE